MKMLLLWLGVAVPLLAQSPSFTYSFNAGSGVQDIAPGGVVQFGPSRPGATSSGTLAVTNRGTAAWTLYDANTVGLGFSSSVTTTSIAPGATANVAIQLTPKIDDAPTGAITLRFSGPNNQQVTASFFLTATVATSGVSTSYALGFSGNQVAIATGETLNFPPTLVGTRVTAAFVITNRGTSPATVYGVLASAEPFDLSGLPLLPATLSGGQELRFTVGFTPTERQSVQGSLAITIDGLPRVFSLAGQGMGPSLSYQVVSATGAAAVAPEAAIAFPATAVPRGTNSVSLRITNNGNSEGRISLISVTGNSFQLADLPAFPLAIAPNASATFTLVFAPREVGDQSGRLRIENTQFNLTGTGLGARFGVTLITGESRAALSTSATALLPNVTVGERYPFSIEVENMGNQAGPLTSIGVIGTGFSLVQLPALPARIEAGAVLRINGLFVPLNTTVSSGLLQVDDQTFPIRAVGGQPPQLPGVTLTGLGDRLEALSQPGVGVRLAQPYPYPISGKLSLVFTSDTFVDEPAVQFLSGGRSIDFTIPANSTDAVFGLSSPQIQFQTGSVAGMIQLDAKFNVGAVEVLPPASVARALTIPAAEPQIRSVQIGNRSGTRFELLISGFSTSRRITQFDFTFTAAPGTVLRTANLSLNVESAFTKWYASTDSRFFGSQFTVTIQFDLTGNGNAVSAVSVTATNPKGTSAAKTVSLQ